jgi:hypothetical protein
MNIFLTSALVGGEWLALCPCHFIPGKLPWSLSKISGSHGGDYEEHLLLGHMALVRTDDSEEGENNQLGDTFLSNSVLARATRRLIPQSSIHHALVPTG